MYKSCGRSTRSDVRSTNIKVYINFARDFFWYDTY